MVVIFLTINALLYFEFLDNFSHFIDRKIGLKMMKSFFRMIMHFVTDQRGFNDMANKQSGCKSNWKFSEDEVLILNSLSIYQIGDRSRGWP